MPSNTAIILKTEVLKGGASRSRNKAQTWRAVWAAATMMGNL